MVDVFVDVPGATPADVEQRVTRPVEKLLWEIPGVEYVYSTSSPGRSMVVVRFQVGEDQERALVRLKQKLAANEDRIPPGVQGPLVKHARSTMCRSSRHAVVGRATTTISCGCSRRQLHDAIKEVPDVSEVELIGGRPRVAGVEIDPARLAVYGVDPLMVRPRSKERTCSCRRPARWWMARRAAFDAGVRVESIAELRDIVITSRGSARPALGRRRRHRWRRRADILRAASRARRGQRTGRHAGRIEARRHQRHRNRASRGRQGTRG
jgi:multidrug efflux pump subunit AcrB